MSTPTECAADTATPEASRSTIRGNWCSYAGADKAGAAQLAYPPNVTVTLDYRGLSELPPAGSQVERGSGQEGGRPGRRRGRARRLPTFESDIKKWCGTTKHLLVKCFVNGDHKIATVQL